MQHLLQNKQIMDLWLQLAFQEDVYGGGMSGLPVAGSKPGGYVPPSLKNRAAGETVDSRKREENSLRVTNLSEDTREEDLRVSI